MRETLIQIAHDVAQIPWGEARTVDDVLKHGVGTCTGKHLLLQQKFDEAGIEYRPVVCTFSWRDQQITFPDHLQRIIDATEWYHGHNFVQVHINGRWIDLDITWDPPLATYGFLSLPDTWSAAEDFVGVRTMRERWNDASITEKKSELIAALTDEQRQERERFLGEFVAWINSLREDS